MYQVQKQSIESSYYVPGTGTIFCKKNTCTTGTGTGTVRRQAQVLTGFPQELHTLGRTPLRPRDRVVHSRSLQLAASPAELLDTR